MESSKFGIEVIQCDQTLPQLLWLKERWIGLQRAEERMQIVAAPAKCLASSMICLT